MKGLFYFLGVISLLISSYAMAVPEYLNHQGQVILPNGSPMTGSSGVVFKLYSNATGGSALWTQTIDVTFDGGYYGNLTRFLNGHSLSCYLSGETGFLNIHKCPFYYLIKSGYYQKGCQVPVLQYRSWTGKSCDRRCL